VFISNDLNKEFYKQLIIYYNKDNSLNFQNFSNSLELIDPSLLSKVRELVLIGEKEFYSLQFSEAKAELISLIDELKKINKYILRKNLEREIAHLEQGGNLEEADKLLKKLQQLSS
jgi:hypothetical protein